MEAVEGREGGHEVVEAGERHEVGGDLVQVHIELAGEADRGRQVRQNPSANLVHRIKAPPSPGGGGGGVGLLLLLRPPSSSPPLFIDLAVACGCTSGSS